MRTIAKALFLIAATLLAGTGWAAPSKKKVPKPSPTHEIPTDPAEALTKAEAAFQSGEFNFSREICNNLETHAQAFEQTLAIRFYLLKSRLEFAAKNAGGAKPNLEKILTINPKFELDPLYDTPEALSMLREIKSNAQAAQVAANAQLGNPETEIVDDPNSTLLRKRAGFWGALLPFGLGHFEVGDPNGGAIFLALDLLSIYASPYFRGKERVSPNSSAFQAGNRMANRGSAVFFAGAWGYEILDAMPTILTRDNFRANWTRYWLSFMPLGVGQMKNGHYPKAIGFGVTQSALLLYSMGGPNAEQRRTAGTILVGTLAYGAFDGWLHHNWINESSRPTVEPTAWQILPSMTIANNQTRIPTLTIAVKL